ncbi:MAG: hypothetical protein M1426_04360 [Patescibacteria group bacterium]|nr:hypothetical protein [Patescibacteria group bacterium]
MESSPKLVEKRPSWMTPWGLEGQGDVFSEFLWVEYPIPVKFEEGVEIREDVG